jgi:hypothetical protein
MLPATSSSTVVSAVPLKSTPYFSLRPLGPYGPLLELGRAAEDERRDAGEVADALQVVLAANAAVTLYESWSVAGDWSSTAGLRAALQRRVRRRSSSRSSSCRRTAGGCRCTRGQLDRAVLSDGMIASR